MSEETSGNLLSSVVVLCHLTESQKHQLNQSLTVVCCKLKPSLVANAMENIESAENEKMEVDEAQLHQADGEKRGKMTEQSKLNSLIAEVENRLSQALCDLPEGFEHLSSSEDSSEDSISGEDEDEDVEEEEGLMEPYEEEEQDEEEEDDRQKKIQEVLRQAETVESELISDSVIIIEDESSDEKQEEREEEPIVDREIKEEKEDRTPMEVDEAAVPEMPDIDASHQSTFIDEAEQEVLDEEDKYLDEVHNMVSNEAVPSPAPSSTPSLKDTDNPHSVFEKPGTKSAKTASAFCSDTLDRYLEENSELNRPTQDAITEYFEPDVDEIDGIKFMSFASREALRKHQAVHRAEVAMKPVKSKGSRRKKSTGKTAQNAGDDIFYKLDRGNLDNLGFNLRPHYGKFGGVRRKSGARPKAPRRGITQTELEKQPSKGLIYGRRGNGRFASKQLMQYHESKKTGDEKGKSARRRPCDLYFNTVAVSTSMALRAVSALQVSSSAISCDKDGCRYGCICHLCDTYNENANLPYDPELPSPPLPKAALPPCGQSHCRLGCVCDSIHSTQPIETLRGSDSQRRSLRVTQRPSYSDLANPKSPFFQEGASKRLLMPKRKRQDSSYTISHPPRSSSSSPNDYQMFPESCKTDSGEFVYEGPIEHEESDDSDCSVLMEADGGASRATPYKPPVMPDRNTQKPKEVSQTPTDNDLVNKDHVNDPVVNDPVNNDPVVNDPVNNDPVIINDPVINDPDSVGNSPVDNDPVYDNSMDNDLVDKSLKVRLVLLKKQADNDASLSLLEVVSYSDWDDVAANLYNFLSMVVAKKLVMQSATIKNYRLTMLKPRNQPIVLPPSLQKRLGRTNAFPDIRILLEHSTKQRSLISPSIKNRIDGDGNGTKEKQESSVTVKEPNSASPMDQKKGQKVTVLQKVKRYVTPSVQVVDIGSGVKLPDVLHPGATRLIIKEGSIQSAQKPTNREEVIELSSEEEDVNMDEDHVDITTLNLRGVTAAKELRKELGVPAPYVTKRKQNLKPRDNDEKVEFQAVIRGKRVGEPVVLEDLAVENERKAKKICRERQRRFDLSTHFESLAKQSCPFPCDKVSKATILNESINLVKFLETKHQALSQARYSLLTRNAQLRAIKEGLKGGIQPLKFELNEHEYAKAQPLPPSVAFEFFQFQKEFCSEDSRERSESPCVLSSPVNSQPPRQPSQGKSLFQTKLSTPKPPKKKKKKKNKRKRSSSLEMNITTIIDNVMPSRCESLIPSCNYDAPLPSPIIHIKEETDPEDPEMPSPRTLNSSMDQIPGNLPEVPIKLEPDSGSFPEAESEARSEPISDINGVKIDLSTVKVVEYKSQQGQSYEILRKESQTTSESSEEESREEHSYAAVSNFQLPVTLPKIT